MTDDLLALIGGRENYERVRSGTLKDMHAYFKRIRESAPETLAFTKGHAKLLRVTLPSLIADLAGQNYVLEKAYERMAMLSANRIEQLEAKIAVLEEHRGMTTYVTKDVDDGSVVVRLRDVAAA